MRKKIMCINLDFSSILSHCELPVNMPFKILIENMKFLKESTPKIFEWGKKKLEVIKWWWTTTKLNFRTMVKGVHISLKVARLRRTLKRTNRAYKALAKASMITSEDLEEFLDVFSVIREENKIKK